MRIVFIADYFLDGMIGGAELSLQSHIDTCPYEYKKVRCRELRFKKLDKADDFIVLSDFEKMSPENLSEIVNWNYVFIESDYKYCIFRSSHKHKAVTGRDCDCDKAPDKRFCGRHIYPCKACFLEVGSPARNILRVISKAERRAKHDIERSIFERGPGLHNVIEGRQERQ